MTTSETETGRTCTACAIEGCPNTLRGRGCPPCGRPIALVGGVLEHVQIVRGATTALPGQVVDGKKVIDLGHRAEGE